MKVKIAGSAEAASSAELISLKEDIVQCAIAWEQNPSQSQAKALMTMVQKYKAARLR